MKLVVVKDQEGKNGPKTISEVETENMFLKITHFTHLSQMRTYQSSQYRLWWPNYKEMRFWYLAIVKCASSVTQNLLKMLELFSKA